MRRPKHVSQVPEGFDLSSDNILLKDDCPQNLKNLLINQKTSLEPSP
jgi:hypothetical protein